MNFSLKSENARLHLNEIFPNLKEGNALNWVEISEKQFTEIYYRFPFYVRQRVRDLGLHKVPLEQFIDPDIYLMRTPCGEFMIRSFLLADFDKNTWDSVIKNNFVFDNIRKYFLL